MICLTFDTDWMTDATLARFLDEFPFPGRGTFFCHDAFPCLKDRGHELAPHPFIDDLTNWREPLERLTERVSPGARGVRAHSCVFSHALAVGFKAMKFEYVSQASELYRDGNRPFRHPWGVWELPIFYMDNMDFWTDSNWSGRRHQPFRDEWIEMAVRGEHLYVMDFHPIHIALNTQSPGDYQRVKARIIDDGVSPFDLMFAGRGARTYFTELCQRMAAAGVQSLTCGEALDQWQRRGLTEH